MKQAHILKLFLAVFTADTNEKGFLPFNYYLVPLSILRGLQRIEDSSRFLRNTEPRISGCFMREAVNGAVRKGKKCEKKVNMKQILKLNFRRIFKNYSLVFSLLVIRR